MSIFIHSSGETKSIINGNVLTDKNKTKRRRI